MTGGPGANAPGKSTGVGAPRPEIGGRAAANAAAAPVRGGAGGVGPVGANRGKGEEDSEHKDKYFVPESPVGEDPLLDEATGAAIDPETGMTVPRPVIGEEQPFAAPQSTAPAEQAPARPVNNEEGKGPRL